MKKKTVEAITKMVEIAAKSRGVNAADCEIRISNQTEPSSCDQTCEWCEGSTHHWIRSIVEEITFWACKHCGHSVDFNDRSNHPSGCDCPDCFPFDDEHPCEDGHSWSPDIGGRICEVCGIKAKGAYAKYEYDDRGRYCNVCCGYVCFCKEGNDGDEEDFDNMSL